MLDWNNQPIRTPSCLNALKSTSSRKIAHVDLAMACMRFPGVIMTEEEISTYEQTHFLTNGQCDRLLGVFKENGFNVDGLTEKLHGEEK